MEHNQAQRVLAKLGKSKRMTSELDWAQRPTLRVVRRLHKSFFVVGSQAAGGTITLSEEDWHLDKLKIKASTGTVYERTPSKKMPGDDKSCQSGVTFTMAVL